MNHVGSYNMLNFIDLQYCTLEKIVKHITNRKIKTTWMDGRVEEKYDHIIYSLIVIIRRLGFASFFLVLLSRNFGLIFSSAYHNRTAAKLHVYIRLAVARKFDVLRMIVCWFLSFYCLQFVRASFCLPLKITSRLRVILYNGSPPKKIGSRNIYKTKNKNKDDHIRMLKKGIEF